MKKFVISAVQRLIYIVIIDVFYGTANRRLSDEDGCVVYLCQFHHTGAAGVHFNKKIDLALKAKCQLQWQKHYNKTTEDFIRRYGRSYL